MDGPLPTVDPPLYGRDHSVSAKHWLDSLQVACLRTPETLKVCRRKGLVLKSRSTQHYMEFAYVPEV